MTIDLKVAKKFVVQSNRLRALTALGVVTKPHTLALNHNSRFWPIIAHV